MPSRSRLAALLSALAVAVSLLVPVAPAVADDVPTPTPAPTTVVEPVETDPPVASTPPDETTPSVETAPPVAPPAAKPPQAATKPPYLGYSIISVNNGQIPFTAQAFVSTANHWWPDGTVFTYQWVHGTTNNLSAATPATGAGAKTQFYTPNTGDSNKLLGVRVVATPPGYATFSTGTAMSDFSIVPDEVIGIGGDTGSVVGATVQVGPDTITWHVAVGGDEIFPTMHHVWRRDGVAIAGAPDDAHYVVQPADAGHVISRVTTLTTPTGAPTGVPTIWTSPNLPIDLQILPDATPVPTIAKTGTTLKATATAPTTAGATLSWKWLRDGTPISGATTASHVLVTADWGHTLSAVATIKKALYADKPGATDFSDFSLLLYSGGTVEDWVTVGHEVYVETPVFETDSAYPVTPATLKYQWLRNGAVISGATHATYTLVAADAGKTISVQTKATYAGYLPYVGTMSGGVVAVTDFAGSHAVTLSPPVASVLTASTTGAIVDPFPETGAPVYKYEWLRNDVVIAGATKSTYKLVAADNGTTTKVRVTVTKPGYTKVTMLASAQATLTAGGPLTFTGPAHSTSALQQATPPTFTLGGASVTPVLVYQWLRDGKPISGGPTSNEYTTSAADRGHTLSVRVTATLDADHPVLVLTSAATQKLGIYAFDHVDDPMVITDCCTNGKLTVTDVTLTPSATYAFQWYRNSSAISGATKSSYTLTSADRGTLTSLKMTATRSNYTTAIKRSTPRDFSVVADSLPFVLPDTGGSYPVGDEMSIIDPAYTDVAGNTVTVSKTYQWYRSGVKITNATLATYVLQAADAGKKISVRVIASAAGLNAVSQVSQATPAVTKGVIQVPGGFFVPNVEPGTTDGQLKGVLATGDVTTPGITLSYQWRRDFKDVKGATKSTFTLASTDAGHAISLLVTVSRPGFTSVEGLSPARIYGIHDTYLPIPAIYGNGKVGGFLYIGEPPVWAYIDDGTPVVPGTLKYQWYRLTGPTGMPVAIAGAIGPTYSPVAADWNKWLKVRQYASGPAVVPASALTGAAGPMALGENNVGGDGQVDLTMNSSTDTLTAAFTNLVPATPAPVLSYVWKRNGNPIPGATKSTYKIVAADDNAIVSVLVTVKRDKFVPANASYEVFSSGLLFSIHEHAAPTFTAGPQVGVSLGITLPPLYESGTEAAVLEPIAKTYQWYAQTTSGAPLVAIPNATGATYTPVGTDLAKLLVAKITVKTPGHAPHVLQTAPSAQVFYGDFGSSSEVPVVTMVDKAKLILHVTTTSTGGYPVKPTSWTYEWIRTPSAGGTPQYIPGATSSSYTITQDDFGYDISVTVTANKLGYTPAFRTTPAAGYWLKASAIYMSASSKVGQTISSGLVGNTTVPVVPSPTITYQWYRIMAGTGTLVKLTGQTTDAYKFVPADVGNRVTCYIHLSKLGYLTKPRESNFNSSVVGLGDIAGTIPTLTASKNPVTRVVSTTFNSSVITTPGVTIAYEWWHSGSRISGATKATYTLPTNALGEYTVFITMTKTGYNTRQVSATYEQF